MSHSAGRPPKDLPGKEIPAPADPDNTPNPAEMPPPGIAKLLLAHCETLATVGSCRHFGGVIGPEVERISAGVAV